MEPNFIFIGPDKSGSSWLYNIFRSHPEIFVPEIKDIYYFDRYYSRGEEWYLSFFNDAPVNTKACGELSHDYLFSLNAVERIKKDFPNIKIFTILRNPIDKIWSHYLFLIRSGITKDPFEKAINEFPELITKSLYYENLKNYYNLFPSEQIGIFLFDDFKKDNKNFAKQIFSFLNVNYIEDLPYEKIVLKASKPRLFLVAKTAKITANMFRKLGFEKPLGKIKANSFIQFLLYKPYENKPEMDNETVELLKNIFNEDIEKTSRLIKKDLSCWL